MAFCGLCRYIPWLNARERHRHLVIQPSTTGASTPDLNAARLDDAKVHTSLGSELRGKLRRGHRHSLGSDVDVYRGSWVKPNGEEYQVAVKILRPFARNGDEHSTNERLRKVCIDIQAGLEIHLFFAAPSATIQYLARDLTPKHFALPGVSPWRGAMHNPSMV